MECQTERIVGATCEVVLTSGNARYYSHNMKRKGDPVTGPLVTADDYIRPHVTPTLGKGE